MARDDELPPKKRYRNFPALPQAADAGEQAPPPVSGETDKSPAQSTRSKTGRTARRASFSVERENALMIVAAAARKRASAAEKNRSDAAGGQPSASVSVDAAAASVAPTSSTGSRLSRGASSSGALKKTNHSDAAKLPSHFGRGTSGNEKNLSDAKAAVGKKICSSVGAKRTPQAAGGGKYKEKINYNGFNSGQGKNWSIPPLVYVEAASMPLAQSTRSRRTGPALASSSEAEARGNALDDLPAVRKKKTPGDERSRHAAMSREPPPKGNLSDAAMPAQAAAPQAAGSGISGDGRNRSSASKPAPAGAKKKSSGDERNLHAAMSREPPPKKNHSDAAMLAHAAALQAAGSGISRDGRNRSGASKLALAGAKKRSSRDEISRSGGGTASKSKAPATSSRGSTQGTPSPADSDEDNEKQKKKKSAPAFNSDKKKSSGDENSRRSGGGSASFW